jgi:hypothetical protein
MASVLAEIQLGHDRIRVYRHRSFRRKKKEQTWFNLTQIISLLNRRQVEGGRKLRATSFTLRKRWRPNRDYKSHSELFGLETPTERTRKSEKKKPQDTWARWPLVWSVLSHTAYENVTGGIVCELLLAGEQIPLDLDSVLIKNRVYALLRGSGAVLSKHWLCVGGWMGGGGVVCWWTGGVCVCVCVCGVCVWLVVVCSHLARDPLLRFFTSMSRASSSLPPTSPPPRNRPPRGVAAPVPAVVNAVTAPIPTAPIAHIPSVRAPSRPLKALKKSKKSKVSDCTACSSLVFSVVSSWVGSLQAPHYRMCGVSPSSLVRARCAC